MGAELSEEAQESDGEGSQQGEGHSMCGMGREEGPRDRQDIWVGRWSGQGEGE